MKLEDLITGKKKETLDDLILGTVRSFAQGASVGTADEAEAGVRAFAGEDYGDALSNIRQAQDVFQERHPYLSGGSEIAGAMLPLIATRGRSAEAQLPRAMARYGAQGAGYGAAYGFGAGEGGPQNRVRNAGIGGAMGGIVGAATPPFAYGLGVGARTVARPIIDAVRGNIAPGSQAAAMTARTVAGDRALGQGLSNQQIRHAQTVTGQPIMNLDVGGTGTRGLARGASSVSPEAEAAISKKLGERFSESGSRTIARWQQVSGRTGDTATREAAESAYRASARPRYLRAYKAGDWNLDSPELRRLSQAKEVQDALAFARQRGDSVAVADKMPWRPSNRRTLQEWDYAQRRLRSLADVANRSGDKETARVLGNLRRDLNKELDALVPEFRDARMGAARFFGADDMWEAGEKFATGSLANTRQVLKALSNASPQERAMFEEGFTSSLIHRINQVRNSEGSSASVVSRIWGNPNARNQIRAVLGSDRAAKFEAFMLIEEAMNISKAAIQKYPGAGRQIAEMAAISGAAGLGGYALTQDPTTAIVLALSGPARMGGRAFAQSAREKSATSIAKLLTSANTNDVVRGVNAIARNRTYMARLRQYIANLASAGTAQQATGE